MKIKSRKIRGGQKSELTLLVNFCRDQPEALEKIVKFMNRPRADKLFPTSAQVRQFIGEHFNIQLARDSQFSSFLKWVELEDVKETREQRVGDAINKYHKENPDATDEELLLIGQRMFKEIAIAEEDPKTWAAILREDIRKRQLGLDERKLALLEKKAAQADATEKAVSDATLTAEERAQRIKEIYGRA